MKDKISLLKTKVNLSMKTILWVLSLWKYLLLAIIISFLFFEFIYWMFNLNIVWTVLSSIKISFFDKFIFLISPIKSIYTTSGYARITLIILLSIIQGISLSILTFTIRNQKKIDSESVGRSSLISLLAVIGLGCPACGTSLLTPILTIFVSTSAVAISEKITTIVLPIAILISLYGLYELGLKASTSKMTRISLNK